MIHTGNLTITPDTLAYANTVTHVSGELFVLHPCTLYSSPVGHR